ARRWKLQNVPVITMDAIKTLRANGISIPLHNTPKPTWPSGFICSIASLPDERQITGRRCVTAMVDTDRVCAEYLELHKEVGVDVHDVGSHCATESTSGGRGGRRFEAEPFDAAAGN